MRELEEAWPASCAQATLSDRRRPRRPCRSGPPLCTCSGSQGRGRRRAVSLAAGRGMLARGARQRVAGTGPGARLLRRRFRTALSACTSAGCSARRSAGLQGSAAARSQKSRPAGCGCGGSSRGTASGCGSAKVREWVSCSEAPLKGPAAPAAGGRLPPALANRRRFRGAAGSAMLPAGSSGRDSCGECSDSGRRTRAAAAISAATLAQHGS